MLVLYFFYTLKKFAELNCNANVRLFFEVTTLLPPFLVIRNSSLFTIFAP